MDTLLLDVRQAIRSLRANPGYTVAAALTLALGIGANTAVFGLAHAVLLRPLPYADSARLVAIWERWPDSPHRPVAPANFLDWRASAESFDGLAAYRALSANLLAPGEPERLAVASVSRNFFTVLGVKLRAGRPFTEADRAGVGDRGAVISADLWSRRFGATEAALGSRLTLDDETVTVLGVAPSSLGLPADVDVWLPAPYDVPELGGGILDADVREIRDARYFAVVGRLAAGVDIETAGAEMNTVAARLAAEHPSTNRDAGVAVLALQEDVAGATRPTLSLLAATVAVLLLIASANVANLTLARSTRRRAESAVRAALGAGRARLVRLSITESLLLGAGGGILGVLLAVVGLRVLVTTMPVDTPRLDTVGVDLRVVAFSALASLLAAVLFGALPARYGSRVDLASTLRSGRSSGDRGSSMRRDLLLGAQIAGALALVAGAGLLLRSLLLLQAVDPGITTEPALLMRVNLPGAEGMSDGGRTTFFRRVQEEVGALPGVTAVGGALLEPLRVGPSAGVRIESHPRPDDELPDLYWNVATPGYFPAAGIPLVRGRLPEPADIDGAPVAVINETAARSLFGGEDPVGAELRTGLDGDDWVRVVGVVGDTRNAGPASDPRPMMFRPLGQTTRWQLGHLNLLVRTEGEPLALARSAREAVWRVRADAPVDRVRSLAELRAAGTTSPRQLFRVLGLLAGLALFLATMGTYAVVSYLVADQAREIAVRMSLGASPGRVVRTTLGRALRTVAAGITAGAILSLLLRGTARELVHGLRASDPLALLAASGLLVAAAMAAAYLPARRAARRPPMRTLRQG